MATLGWTSLTCRAATTPELWGQSACEEEPQGAVMGLPWGQGGWDYSRTRPSAWSDTSSTSVLPAAGLQRQRCGVWTH